jgi:hypothetical protein
MEAILAAAPIIPAQVRAARALVGISQEELAASADVGLNSVRDVEGQRRGDEVGAMKAIVRALENEGVTFLPGDADNGPGVRLVARLPNVIVRPTKMASGVLPFTVEWKGQRVIVCVEREPLEDLERGNFHNDAQFVAAFEKYRRAVLEAAANAIDADKVTRDGRVYLSGADFPSLR